MKGKGKSPTAAIEFEQATQALAQPSIAQQTQAISPLQNLLCILTTECIEFLPYAPIGRGAFGQVSKVKVKLPTFQDDVYTCKTLSRGEDIMTAEMLAIHEATIMSISHGGIIAPLVLCRRPPMLISKFWNGGHLDHWIQIIRTDGTRPMPMDFVDTISTTKLFIEHIMHTTNGLLATLSYVHDFNILHNDIHGPNILLYLGREVYVGLADWGRATKLPTTDHFPSMINNEDKATKNELKRKYKHVAPECICTSPPPYSKAQDVYSVSYQVQQLVYCIPHGSRKDTFVDHVL